nr:hypothetical protein [Tanacetum cinerariifolium]
MAQELLDGEFWLPPEFLNDDDFVTGKPTTGKGFYGLGSGSPVESFLGSNETESDEEDYLNLNLNGLTRQFENTTFQDHFWKSEANLKFENKGTRVMSGSPQSTLCGCKSPNCMSPPVTAAPVNRDLLFAAAGEVARMRMIEEAASRYYLGASQQQPPRKTSNPNLSQYQQLQLAQFQQLKHQQMMKQQQYLQMIQQQNRKMNDVNGNGNGRNVTAPLSTWSTQQQSQQARTPGSGMRAVFLGNPTTKRESTGTGVFLPRQVGAPVEPNKKRGCSTVLLPDRVVQALNLNLEKMENESKLLEAKMVYRNSVKRQQPPVMTEFRLPQEWTY